MADFNEDELLEKVEKAAEKGAKKHRKGGFLVGLVIGIVATVAVFILGPGFKMIYTLRDSTGVEKPVVGHDLTLKNSGIFGYTAADFKEAVLGAAEKKAELIVYQRDVSDTTKLTDTGFLNWKVFDKTQNITFHGTAIYVVDMKNIGVNDISVDDDKKTVTIKIPHATLKTVDVNPMETEVEDPEKGILAFGDLKLTADQEKQIETEAEKRMTAKLAANNVIADADEAAVSSTTNLFDVAVNAMDDSYKVNVEFQDAAQ